MFCVGPYWIPSYWKYPSKVGFTYLLRTRTSKLEQTSEYHWRTHLLQLLHPFAVRKVCPNFADEWMLGDLIAFTIDGLIHCHSARSAALHKVLGFCPIRKFLSMCQSPEELTSAPERESKREKNDFEHIALHRLSKTTQTTLCRDTNVASQQIDTKQANTIPERGQQAHHVNKSGRQATGNWQVGTLDAIRLWSLDVDFWPRIPAWASLSTLCQPKAHSKHTSCKQLHVVRMSKISPNQIHHNIIPWTIVVLWLSQYIYTVKYIDLLCLEQA